MPRIVNPDLQAILERARREGPSPYLKHVMTALEEADSGLHQHYDFVRLQKQQMDKRRKK